MVTSASIAENAREQILSSSLGMMQRHLIFLCLSVFVWGVTLQIPMRIWENYNVFLLLSTIVLLVLVLFIGKTVNGSMRWISLGPINFQPSELGKLALLRICLAICCEKTKSSRRPQGLSNRLLFFVLALLLLAQPDLGSVIVLFVTVVGMLFIAGARLSQFLGLVLMGAAAVVTLILISPLPCTTARILSGPLV